MSNLLTSRLTVPMPEPLPESSRTPADFKDRDGWPIRLGARVTVARNSKRKTGEVRATFTDWKGREVVEFSVDGALHATRPEFCRVQYQKGTRNGS